MALSIDAQFGIHAQAMLVFERRSQMLASNIANADTPKYKAQDIDFRAALSQATTDSISMARTSGDHLNGTLDPDLGVEVQFRVPDQASLDGNTVDLQQEKARMAENSLRYQAALRFLTGKINSLRGAIRGE